MLGAFLFGILAVYLQSEALFLLASCAFGMAMGMGFHLRFAALGVVSSAHHKSFAMTLVVSGGCLAAFAGPEAAQGTINMIQAYPYMGTMIMTGIYHVLNAVFLLMVMFPETVETKKDELVLSKDTPPSPAATRPPIYQLLLTRSFLVPMLLSSCSWATMAMPMGIVRIAMASVGYTSRQSLYVMEMHFLGMYAPGFVTGKWIQASGYKFMCRIGCAVFMVALILLQVVRVVDHFALWAIGMVLIGVGWNFVFTSSTVWLTKGNLQEQYASSTVRAMHDFFMFMLSGIWILSASFIYAAGGEQLSGWGLLLWVVLGIWAFMLLLLVFDFLGPHITTKLPAAVQSDANDKRTDTPKEALALSVSITNR
ncbi:hypothetical protein MPSEU_000847900 [Mayamaea pseudoterrestris]|nr:hypothetical protein MPSEU_000847900 [Mayamaea pseudoterrestris]